MTDVELLPCPFCGSADALRLRNTHTAAFWIACSEDDGGCGAKMSGEFFPGPPRRTRFCYDPEAPKGSKFDARTLDELHPEYRRAAESAIAAWNRRANVAHATAAKDAEIERLRAEVKRLRALAGCAYQMAGVHDAPLVWLDRLSEAANGYALPDADTLMDELLPYQPNAVCEAEARAERLAEALRVARARTADLAEWLKLRVLEAAMDQEDRNG